MAGFESEALELLLLMGQERDSNEIVCDIRDLIARTLGTKTVEIFQYDRRLNRYYQWTKEGPDGSNQALHRHDPLVMLAERERRVLTASDWAHLPVPEDRPKAFSEVRMVLPLFVGKMLVGLVAMTPQGEAEFSKRPFLEAVRGALALLLENSRLRSLVIEDPVTGLRSHDYFVSRLTDEVERAHRYQHKISLMMIRLEPLSKLLQDVSPLMAERILRQVGTILMENTRRTNVVARFLSDSDVFQLMMPEIPGDIALRLGETLAQKLNGMTLEGIKQPLQVFFGVATFPDDAPSRQILSAKAFANLNERYLHREATARPSTPTPSKLVADFAQELDIRNPEMLALFETAYRIADSKSTVLILGETGVGKEVMAEFVHRHSSRAPKSLVKVNCGALPENLVESELFGHEKGSFTGEEARRIGRFELAHEGTIFLDEIGELTLSAQVKILRIIEGKPFYRLGGTAPIATDVRIVAATNRDLLAEVQKGNFREDLYYRLNVISFSIPPLRERREDIPVLISRFIKNFNKDNNTNVQVVHPEAMDILYRYHWPGNIRELKNAVERAMILTGNERTLVARYLPPSVLKGASETPGRPPALGDGVPRSAAVGVPKAPVSMDSAGPRFPDLNERQRQVIEYLRVHSFISNQQYVSLMSVSRRTCVRDLNELIDKRLVIREGKKKSCIYRLADGV